MNADERLEIDTVGSPVSPRLQSSSSDVPEREGRSFFGSIFALAMVGGEIVWLCILAYLAYRLLP